MAINSRDKRMSATTIVYGLPGLGGPPPTPDGTINAADRMHITGFYRGIAAASPVAVVARRTSGLLLKVY